MPERGERSRGVRVQDGALLGEQAGAAIGADVLGGGRNEQGPVEGGGDHGGVHRRPGVVQGLDEDHRAHERGDQDGAGPGVAPLTSVSGR
ncbi:hypothetical protein ACFXDI_40210 [Streptomyces mirabilis]|uniref:hypothetical protein n=1 Tax=Streptomyces mirabilis TaxID=68239 RepID=UPI0036872E84